MKKIAVAFGVALSLCAPAVAQDEYRSRYKVGEQVRFTISGRPADFQPCVVAENKPNAVMRVRCGAFRNWAAGTYIVYGPSYIASAQGGAAAAPKPAARPPARPAAARPAGGGSLKLGEYACYGSGGRLMIGLGFKVLSGGRYTDLDGKSPGTFVVSGGNVSFKGGHLGGQTGRDLKNGKFTIGAQAGCEPF